MVSEISIWSAALLFLFVIDPFGNVPILLSALKNVPPARRTRIVIRDGFIGLGILLLFLFFGPQFLALLHLETESISIAGGVVLFVIALKLIFPGPQGTYSFAQDDEPLIIPVAMPMLAGPSTLATLLVVVKGNPGRETDLLLAILAAWAVSVVVLACSPLFYRLLRDRGLAAVERLMGMLLLMMSVQMLVNGIRGLVPTLVP